jgi:hypothetical protein
MAGELLVGSNATHLQVGIGPCRRLQGGETLVPPIQGELWLFSNFSICLNGSTRKQAYEAHHIYESVCPSSSTYFYFRLNSKLEWEQFQADDGNAIEIRTGSSLVRALYKENMPGVRIPHMLITILTGLQDSQLYVTTHEGTDLDLKNWIVAYDNRPLQSVPTGIQPVIP